MFYSLQFYFSGQEVIGQIEFTLEEPKKYKSVEIKLTGFAVVEIYELTTDTHGAMDGRKTYRATETYVDKTLVLWEQAQSPDGKIGPGHFIFAFQFTLPENCQSSYPEPVFEWLGRSWIEYKLFAKIVTGEFLTTDPKFVIPLKVRKVRDINNIPNLMLPVHQSGTAMVGCCCCASGEMQFSVDVPSTAACTGQNFPVTVSVQNSSSSNGICMNACIQRKWTYLAMGHMKEKYDTIVIVSSPAIDPYSEYTWEVDNLLIPFDAMPTLEGCSILKTEDSLEVTAVIPWGLNESVTIPVTIGNVPLRDYQLPNSS